MLPQLLTSTLFNILNKLKLLFMNSLKRLVALAFIGFSTISYSQSYLGVHSSNYAGVMGTDLNPASFVDGRFKVDINLGSFNFNTYTNAGYLDTKQMPKWWKKSFLPDVNPSNELNTYYAPGASNQYNDWAANPDSSFNDAVFTRNYKITDVFFAINFSSTRCDH